MSSHYLPVALACLVSIIQWIIEAFQTQEKLTQVHIYKCDHAT